MKIIRFPTLFRKTMERLHSRGRTIGFVPTMGALHEGHLSLIGRARRENQVVVASLFVNPLQFGPREDFKSYPRNLGRDRRLLSQKKVDYLFIPDAVSFYPAGFQTFVEVAELSRGLCGKFRPGHFRGVATVVTKLFNVVRPDRTYFGAKDYQQAVLIRRMAKDLNFDIEVKILPTVRDQDGLALSSRNAYLSIPNRAKALAIPQALAWLKEEVRTGKRNLGMLRSGVRGRLRRSLDQVDYVEFVEPMTLQSVKRIRGPFVAAVAGWVGKTRLIDNAIIHP